MSRGPKWSEDSVRTLLLVVRSKLEGLGGGVKLSSERLDEECQKQLELEKYVGKHDSMKATALWDWVWKNALAETVAPTVVAPSVTRGPTNIDEELDKLVKLLKENDTATLGGIRNALFINREKVFEETIAHGFRTGRIKKEKTNAGSEVIVLG
jgi:hypothetical protein